MVEQAKGKLAERISIDMDHAFTMLRDYARNSNQRLTDVARIFVEGATADFPAPASHESGAAHQNQPGWPDSAQLSQQNRCGPSPRREHLRGLGSAAFGRLAVTVL